MAICPRCPGSFETLLLSGHDTQVYFVDAPDPGRRDTSQAMALRREQYVNSREQRGLSDSNHRKEP